MYWLYNKDEVDFKMLQYKKKKKTTRLFRKLSISPEKRRQQNQYSKQL